MPSSPIQISPMRVAIDTNVLLYAAGIDDVVRQQRATQFLHALHIHERCISVQVLGEYYRVLKRKAGLPAAEAQALLEAARAHVTCIDTTTEVLDSALELCSHHRFDIWDAIILSAAAQARCDILLSEDGHSGFIWRGVTVIDPFAGELHPLAVHLLRTG